MDKKPVSPRVTVLMSVYNGERFIEATVRSVLGQTFSEFEFLIVNDGSTDRTRELVASYNDPRVRLVDNNGNIGQTRSLNRGLRMAAGELIARQDSDDVSEPERLRKQVNFMDSHPEVALLGTWYTKIDERGLRMGERSLPCDSTGIR